MSMNDLLIECQNKVAQLEAERDKLANRVEELQAMQVDAQGDGYYDGYLACQRDIIDGVDPREVKVNDILQLSEKYESEHRYSKSIADIRATSKNKDDVYRLLNAIHSMAGTCAVAKAGNWQLASSCSEESYTMTTWTNGIVDVKAVTINGEDHTYSLTATPKASDL